MRLHQAGIPSVRDRASIPTPSSARGLFARVFLVLLLVIGATWSRQASAAVATCALSAGSNATSQSGAGNTSLTFGFDAVNGFACNTAIGTVAIQSDGTGGASITSGAAFNIHRARHAYRVLTGRVGR